VMIDVFPEDLESRAVLLVAGRHRPDVGDEILERRVLDFGLVDQVGFVEPLARRRVEEFLFERRVQVEVGAGLLDERLAALRIILRVEFLEIPKGFPDLLVVVLEALDDRFERFRSGAAARARTCGVVWELVRLDGMAFSLR
jgi:hypothetical protein